MKLGATSYQSRPQTLKMPCNGDRLIEWPFETRLQKTLWGLGAESCVKTQQYLYDTCPLVFCSFSRAAVIEGKLRRCWSLQGGSTILLWLWDPDSPKN